MDEEYLHDFFLLFPFYIRDERNFKRFVERSKIFGGDIIDGSLIENLDNEFKLDLNFFIENDIKFAPSPTFIHFYDLKRYPIEINKLEVDVNLEILKEYEYLFAVAKDRIYGVLKSQIKALESTGKCENLIIDEEQELDTNKQTFEG